MVGVFGAPRVVTMGIIALPAMLRRNYDHKIALGSIMAGGHPRHPHPAVHPGDSLRRGGAAIGSASSTWARWCRA